MTKIPDQYLRTATLLIHSLLIVVGIIVIGLGIILSHRYDARLERDETLTMEIFELSITVGLSDIAIGICGICAALMKLRVLHITNSTLLALTLIVNLLFLAVCGLRLNLKGDKASAIQRKKETYRLFYGDSTDDFSQVFTSSEDSFQNLYSCCGWTGLDGDNIYLSTPWHKLANENVTAGKKTKTLPESCCIKPDDPQCQTAENVKEAREKGLVYKKDCMDVAFDKMFSPFSGYILQIVLSSAFQIPSAALTVIFLLRARQETAAA